MRFPVVFPTADIGGIVNTASQISPAGAPSTAELVGRVGSISGGQAKITLAEAAGLRAIDNHATVGRFLGIQSGAALIIGMISAVDQEQGAAGAEGRSVARVELIGEIRTTTGVPRFQRGIEGYPKIGDGARSSASCSKAPASGSTSISTTW
jgi:hypothetical protein